MPPKLAERLLRWLVGGRDADAVTGDLRETFQERGGGVLWYWWQVASCLAVRISPSRRMLPGLGADFHYALRLIRRNPGYALTAMLCLALAMGVNTTLFSFLNSMYFRKLPVADAGRIVRITRGEYRFCNWPEYFEIRDHLRSVEAAAQAVFFDDMEIDRVSRSISSEHVSANYAQVLRLGTALGSWFTNANDRTPPAPVAVISYRVWQKRFLGDPNAVGQQIRIHDEPYRIVGVARPDFLGAFPPFATDVWVMVPARRARGARINLIARLAPGATLESATSEMRVVASHLPPDPENDGPPSLAQVRPFVGFGSDQWRVFGSLTTILSVVCGVVLLIACVNVGNLLLSRSVVRRHEMAVRQALGAGRARLFRATFVEGLVLACGGIVLGLAGGFASGRLLEWAKPSVPRAYYQGIQLGIDWRVGLWLAAAGVACAVLFSLAPAIGSRLDLNAAMKRTEGGPRSRQREFYSLLQVALSLALLIGTGLLLRGLDRVEHIDPGFATDHRLFVNLRASMRDLTPEQSTLLYSDLLGRARALPGVIDATLAWQVLGTVGMACASKSATEEPGDARENVVEPNYFDMMRVPILRGSGLPRNGALTDAPAVVVNETMARTYWPGEDPLGKLLWLGCQGQQRKIGQVVGVAADTRNPAYPSQSPTGFYRSRLQDPGNSYFGLIIQTTGDPYLWSKPLMSVAQSGGAHLRIFDMRSMADDVGLLLWEARWQAALLSSLGALAAVLAAIGLYGVVAFTVAQRTREIGVRMALGAAPADVQWMILGHGLRITGVGIAAGLLLSAGTVHWLRGFLYGLSPFDPIAFAAASLVWILIAMLASWYPARRATRVDPLTALQYE
ncbi:MAG TPA: ADOP family duplicated permease [Bryobacteraceae bacterium]|nr:ADOP family duplicated permease [Bryobacteraceae bacterium]